MAWLCELCGSSNSWVILLERNGRILKEKEIDLGSSWERVEFLSSLWVLVMKEFSFPFDSS